jgi:colanic acid biosynthesis glycosyl transferase WcaI
VLATARSGTELARVVSGRGLLTPPDDLDAFVDALTTLVASPDLRERLGDAARRYAEEHLARDRVLSDLLLELKGCVLGLTPRRAVPDEPAASALGDPPVKTV